MIRLAAVGDLHAGRDAREAMASHFAGLADEADLLLLAGDLTRSGHPEEAEALAGVLRDTGVPVVAVLGNVDYDAERAPEIVTAMRDAGVHLLDRSSVVLDVGDEKVAIAGVKGFGGGFGAALAEVSGEPEMRAWVQYAEDEADALEGVLSSMMGDVRLALLHYAPITDTVLGERLERYAFAGNSMLGAAIDRAGADLVLHGHIHRGSPAGRTQGGIPVRNVAQQVIREPYVLFTIERAEEMPQRERRRWRREQREQRIASRLPWRRRRQRGQEAPETDDPGSNA
jgi:Icc-related predicted phosphoesterase